MNNDNDFPYHLYYGDGIEGAGFQLGGLEIGAECPPRRSNMIMGATGPTGPAGATGLIGPTGPTGATGPLIFTQHAGWRQ